MTRAIPPRLVQATLRSTKTAAMAPLSQSAPNNALRRRAHPGEHDGLTWSTVALFFLTCLILQPARAATVATEPSDAKLAAPVVSSANVFWVGHSLIEQRAETVDGTIGIMSLVRRFAESRGLGYRGAEHTLWGASLSALWRGRPHGYDRDASAMVAKRQKFEQESASYDTLVLTEGIPIAASLKGEFSAYYLRRFYCALKGKNRGARVFLSQTWVHLQGTDPNAKYPPSHKFQWRSEMQTQRKQWEALADAAQKPEVVAPGWLSKFGLSRKSDAGCPLTDTIHIVPVGDVFLALAERLADDRVTEHWIGSDGKKLKIEDLYANPYSGWPERWPDDAARAEALLASLSPRDPSRPVDDIHSSATGIYVSALVHFAAIYRQSPVGLAHPSDMHGETARSLQCLVWEIVVNDVRSGVGTAPLCDQQN